MSADVMHVPRPQAVWAALITWAVLTGCATPSGMSVPHMSNVSRPVQYRLCTPQDASTTAGEPSDETTLQSRQKCVALICRDPDDLATCYCPATLPDGRRQPLSLEECKETLEDPGYDHQFDFAGTTGGSGKGERGKAAKPDGTDNPFKKMRPDPNDPSKVIYKDPHTGKDLRKPKPPGFDDWWSGKR